MEKAKRVVIHSAGGYDKLKIEVYICDAPKDYDVQIDVDSSGINYADVCVRWGIYESAKKYVGWPITPGFEVSGVVKNVGKKVTSFKAGDEVIGVTFFNGYSSLLNVPEHQCFLKPKNLTFEQAACFPSVFMTAYHALFQNFILRKGSKVLVHSAAGGVGSSLVQLLKWYECEVTGVVGREEKREYLERLNVDHIIVKSKEDIWKRAKEIVPGGYDVILDANGVDSIKKSYEHLRPTGKLVIYGFHTMLPRSGGVSFGRLNWPKLILNYLKTPRFNPINLTSDNKSLVAFNLSFLFEEKHLLEEAMNKLIDLVKKNELSPHHITSFHYNQVDKAHEYIESGKSIGKIAIRWK